MLLANSHITIVVGVDVHINSTPIVKIQFFRLLRWK